MQAKNEELTFDTKDHVRKIWKSFNLFSIQCKQIKVLNTAALTNYSIQCWDAGCTPGLNNPRAREKKNRIFVIDMKAELQYYTFSNLETVHNVLYEQLT